MTANLMTSSIAIAYLGFSIFTFAAYWMDKRAAVSKRHRISERTLLVLGLVGGWPGGLVAQQTLRHKTRKVSFQVLFWISVLANLAFVGWLFMGSSK